MMNDFFRYVLSFLLIFVVFGYLFVYAPISLGKSVVYQIKKQRPMIGRKEFKYLLLLEKPMIKRSKKWVVGYYVMVLSNILVFFLILLYTSCKFFSLELPFFALACAIAVVGAVAMTTGAIFIYKLKRII